MNSDHSLSTIHKVAVSRENDAAQEYSSAIRILERQNRQRQELASYMNEYYSSIEVINDSITIQKITNTRKFLIKVKEALEYQDKAIVNQEAQIERKYQLFIEARKRRELIERLIERKRQQRDTVLSRDEQKLLDEIAGRPSVS